MNNHFLQRIMMQTRLITFGHILNWPWRDRLTRRRVRYSATQRAVNRYLDYLIPAVASFKADFHPYAENEEYAFTAWLQGEESAPPIVKACFRSMKRHLKQKLVIIDNSNLHKWVELPDYVIEKWKSGKMRTAHFVDICRVDLLWRHGGVWLDATDFITSPIPQWILDEDFFIFLSGETIRGSYSFVQNCFFRARKGSPLLGLWRNAILEYWKNEDSVVNYFTHQLLFRLTVENNLQAKELFSKMPKSIQDPTHTVWDFHKDDPFNQDIFDNLTKDAFFQKTEYKSKSSESPIKGSFADEIIKM